MSLLEKYVQAARLAPSAGNQQPLKYIIVSGSEMNEKVFSTLKWAGYLAPAYNPKKYEQPVAYIVVCVDLSISRGGYDMDVGAAVQSMIMSAYEDGVGACWIGSVNREKLSGYLDIDDSLKISSVLALGYPAESPEEVELPEDKSIEYYLDGDTLQVPKRPVDEVLIKTL